MAIKESTMGTNRTGVQMSPLEAQQMEAGVPTSMMPATPGDETALAELRSSYIVNADPVGSIPIPATLAGAMTADASMLNGHRSRLLLDKLGERLAFERTSVRLYDALITKFETTQDETSSMTLADLQQMRQQEARHFAILAEAIQSLGADPTAQTPCADLVGVEALGLMQVVTDPRTTIAQSLHAILVGELTDQVGWEQLVSLAEDQGQDALVTDFNLALTEERIHLQRVQQWYQEATLGMAISDGASIDDVSDAPPAQLH
jgi:rubrerythrin